MNIIDIIWVVSVLTLAIGVLVIALLGVTAESLGITLAIGLCLLCYYIADELNARHREN